MSWVTAGRELSIDETEKNDGLILFDETFFSFKRESESSWLVLSS